MKVNSSNTGTPYILFYSKNDVSEENHVCGLENLGIKDQIDQVPRSNDSISAFDLKNIKVPLAPFENDIFNGHVDENTPLTDDEKIDPPLPLTNENGPLVDVANTDIPLMTSQASIVKCSSYSEVDSSIKNHQLATNTQYYHGARTLKFGSFNIDGCQVMFKDVDNDKNEVLKFDGIPFMITGRYYLPCTHGVDTNYRQKKKLLDEKQSLPGKGSMIDHDFCTKKRRRTLQATRKKNCKATVAIREIIYFPNYKIDKDSKHFRRLSSEKLRSDLENSGLNGVCHEKRFIVVLPSSSSHSGHAVDYLGGLSQHMDKRLTLKINELVKDGVQSVEDVKRHLNYYVKKDLFKGCNPPHMYSRSFFPLERDIRNHMYNTLMKLRFSKVDQENLELQVDEWRKDFVDDHFFFRGYGEREKSKNHDIDDYTSGSAFSNRLLFIHQTQNQRNILRKYGNHICLLDATYKTTRYAVPFLL